MNTFLSIEIFHPDEERKKEALVAAFNEVNRIERLLSRFREGSQVYMINNSAYQKPQTVDEELLSLVTCCLEFSDKSEGAFDITVAPLIDLWHQAEKKDSLPGREEVCSLLPNIGYKNIVIDTKSRTIALKNPILKIDMGAVGKGYALDRAVAILEENEIKKARLDFGGHLYYFDKRLDREPDCIGIRNPFKPDELITSLLLSNQSISTSANYERNSNIQGRTFGHLINPKTGFPMENEILSVSVISPSALYADILSTAVFILGLERGMRLIEGTKVAEVIIITKTYGKLSLHTSLELKEVMQQQDSFTQAYSDYS